MSEREPILQRCLCTKARAAARAVTNAYDDALRATGLRATQFALLAALSDGGGAVSIAALARGLGMDRTTLSRNLGPLEKRELVRLGQETRHRSRRLEITDAGRVLMATALPIWEGAQARLERSLGPSYFGALAKDLDRLATAGNAADDAEG